MNKTTTINLSGQLFNIDEDAYAELKAYLDRLKRQLEHDEDAAEIMADFEQAVAEHLLELLLDKQAIVSVHLVKKISKTMGEYEPSEALDETPEPAATTNWQSFFKHPLYLDKKNALIGGVCSGIARSLEVDSFWIRLIFVLLAVLTQGLIIVVYIALLLIMKEPQGINEELAASGTPQTAAALVARSKQRFAKAKLRLRSGDTRRHLEPAATLVKRLIRFAGVLISVVGITVVTVGYSVLLITWLTHRNSAQQPFYAVPSPYMYGLLTASFFILILPLSLLLLVALSKRAAHKALTAKSLVLVLLPWLAALVVFVTAAVQVVPKLADWSQQHPDNPYFQLQIHQGHVDNFCLSIAGRCNDQVEVCSTPLNVVSGCPPYLRQPL